MNIVKQVEFMGDSLLAIKDDSGICVGIRWICQGLGLTDNQRIHQTAKVQSDLVISKGVRKIPTPTSNGIQDVICLDITYLPLWLAKINARLVKSDVQSKLVEYQLKCKDVLADSFNLSTPQATSIIPQLPTNFQEALRLLADSQDTIEYNKPKVLAFDSFLASEGNQTMSQAAKSLGTGRDRLFNFLRNQGILMYGNEPYQAYINAGFFDYIEGVQGCRCNGRTLVTPKGIVFIDGLMNIKGRSIKIVRPAKEVIETLEDIQRVMDKFKATTKTLIR